jgi:KDO2-lipid IV(A) lauroyltransferase
MKQPLEKPRHFYAVKNWPIFLIKGLLWLLSKLPYRLMLSVGNGLGALISGFNTKNNRLILRNLELCFPEKTLAERKKIAKQCWQSHAVAALETAMGWWGSSKKLRKRLIVKGENYLREALATKRGIMLIASHFTSLELQGVMISLLADYSATAKHLRNPVADYEINKARRRHLQQTFFPENLKQVHRNLQQGRMIGFLLDQDYGAKGSVFAPFFNIPTATTTTMARIAAKTNSIAIPTFFYRNTKEQTYTLEFLAPLENYPSDDALADATQFNQLIEQYARRYPEQYGWTYRRFATRPAGEASLYTRSE